MVRNPAPQSGSDNIGRIVVLIVLAIGVSAFGTVAWVSCTSDSDGDGVRDCTEIATGKNPLGGGGEGDDDVGLCGRKSFCAAIQPTTTPPPTTTSCVPPSACPPKTSPPPTTTSSPTSPPTTKPPYTSPPPVTSKPPATTAAPVTTAPATTAPPTAFQPFIRIHSTTMNSLYGESSSFGHPLSLKIFLLRPGETITETVDFGVVGGSMEDVSIEFSLIQGALGTGFAHAPLGYGARPQKTLNLGYLPEGAHTREITGVVPPFNPGRDWHAGLIVIKNKGVEMARQTNVREDTPGTGVKWLTLAYDNVWSDTPGGISNSVSSVYSTEKPGEGVVLYFTTPYATIESKITFVTVFQLSYPGKWKMVHNGTVESCVSTNTLFGMSLPCLLGSGGGASSVFIPFSRFAPAYASESYLKVEAYSELNNKMDLNAAENDMAARINLPYYVEGGSAWSGTQEYFSFFGVNRIMPFSVFGGGGHPEAQWFR